jgi:hypothetical protein
MKLKSTPILLTFILSFSILAGCAAIPAYHLPKDIKYTARVNVRSLSLPMIFENKTFYSLKPDSEGFALIPAANEVTIGNNYVKSNTTDNQDTFTIHTHSCFPVVHFVPRNRQDYYLKFSVKNKICELVVLRRHSKS